MKKAIRKNVAQASPPAVLEKGRRAACATPAKMKTPKFVIAGFRVLIGIVSLLGFLGLFAGTVATAQLNTAAVCPEEDCGAFFPLIDSDLRFQSLTGAVQAARDNPNITTIQISSGTFGMDLATRIPASLQKIEGLGNPQNVIIEPAEGTVPGLSVLEIETTGLVIEGLTISASATGITVMSAAEVTINRCLILNNSQSGIVVKDTATALIINCSIVDNDVNGVSIEDGATAQIVSCSLIDNVAGNGVRIDTTGPGTEVRNTLIMNSGADAVQILGGSAFTGEFIWLFQNNADVAPGATNITDGIDPLLRAPDPASAITPWKGQIQLEPDPSPLIDAGGDISGFPFNESDFDGHERPFQLSGPGPIFYDIGADEVPADPNASIWTAATVSPDPPIGVTPAGGLLIALQFSGGEFGGEFTRYDGNGDVVNASTSQPNQLFIVPEELRGFAQQFLGSIDVAKFLIPVNPTARYAFGSVNGIWIGTNAVPIETTRTSDTFGVVDSDGLALLILVRENVSEAFRGPAANDGRLFLIDTIPPWMVVPPLPGGALSTGAAPDGIVFAHNGFAPDVVDPLLPGFPLGSFPRRSDSLITEVPGGQGAKIFFNTAGDLTMTIQVLFRDGARTGGLVGGFPVFPMGAFNITLDELLGTGPAGIAPFWVLDAGRDLLTAAQASMTIQAQYDSVPGGADLLATWILTNIPNPFLDDQNKAWHLAIRFVAKDAAGNVTPDELILDPLHIWWLDSAETRLSPYLNGEVADPRFRWNLRRSADPGPSQPAEPRFAYRLLASQNRDNPNGPYVASLGLNADLTAGFQGLSTAGWSGWSPFKTPPATFFNGPFGVNNTPVLVDRWLLFVVIGADEAGNVGEWPSELFLDGDGNVTSASFLSGNVAGRNWQRFIIPEPGDVIETEVLAGTGVTLWHNRVANPNAPQRVGFNDAIDSDELVLSSMTVLQLPADPGGFHLEAEFIVRPSVPTADNVDPPPTVIWELSAPGDSEFDRIPGAKISGVIDVLGPDGFARLVLPLHANFLFEFGNRPIDEFGNRVPGSDDPVTYVLRLTTISFNNIEDDTPVNFKFTVSPNVRAMIENRDAPDEQPVKVIETN